MSAASYSRRSAASITCAGEAAVSIWKPSPLSSRRSASRTSGWSSATRTRAALIGSGSICASIHHPAVAQLDHPVAVSRVGFRVGHLHDGRARFVELAEQLHDLAPLLGVQVDTRLVRMAHCGLGNECN